MINKNSPFQPVFYALDSSEVDAAGQQALNANAEILRKYPTWVITIEGHCDERGTADTISRSASGARWRPRPTWCRSASPPIGCGPSATARSFRSIPGHDEAAWSKNRRAHFVVTSK